MGLSKPIVVQIIKNWTDKWMSDAALLSQTPEGSGYVRNVKFVLGPVEEPDYVIVLNRAPRRTEVRCRPSNLWLVLQEPPNEICAPLHKGQSIFSRVYMSDPRNVGPRYQLSHPPIPHFIGVSHDFLVDCPVPDKSKQIGCILSYNRMYQGHEARQKYFSVLSKHIAIDHYGIGVRDFKSKWDTFAPYRYAVVLENFVHPWYWSEKIADTFLTWTMPFYLGSSRIHEYFSKAAVQVLPPDDPIEGARIIRSAIEADLWSKNFSALQQARDLVIQNYGLFAFLAHEIERNELRKGGQEQPIRISIPPVSAAILGMWARSKFRAFHLNALASLQKLAPKQDHSP